MNIDWQTLLLGGVGGVLATIVVQPVVARLTTWREGPFLFLWQSKVFRRLKAAIPNDAKIRIDYEEGNDERVDLAVIDCNGSIIAFVEIKSWLRWCCPTIRVVGDAVHHVQRRTQGTDAQGLIIVQRPWLCKLCNDRFGASPAGVRICNLDEAVRLISKLTSTPMPDTNALSATSTPGEI